MPSDLEKHRTEHNQLTAAGLMTAGSNVLFDIGFATTPNLELTPITVGYFGKLKAPATSQATEVAGIYHKLDHSAGQFTYAIYGEITTQQTLTGGAFSKLIHKGKGDGHYVALMRPSGDPGGFGYEAAMFTNGNGGFIATLQGNLGFPDSEPNQANSTGFQALWGDDGVDAGFVPNYGMFFANNSPGHAFTARRNQFCDPGVVQMRVTEPSYRGRWYVFGHGGQHMIGNEASGGTPRQTSPDLVLKAQYWNGSASVDRNSVIRTVVDSLSDTAEMRFLTGPTGTETLGMVLNATALNLQGHNISSVATITMQTGGASVVDMQSGDINNIDDLNFSAGGGSQIDLQGGDIIGVELLQLKTDGTGVFNLQGGDISSVDRITFVTAATSLLDMQGGDISGVDDLTFQAGGGGLIDLQGGDITAVDDFTFSGAGSILNLNGGDISGVDDFTFAAGGGSVLDLQTGDIINVNQLGTGAAGFAVTAGINLEVRGGNQVEASSRINITGTNAFTSGIDFYTGTTDRRGFVGWRGTSSGTPATTGMHLINYDNTPMVFSTNGSARLTLDGASSLATLAASLNITSNNGSWTTAGWAPGVRFPSNGYAIMWNEDQTTISRGIGFTGDGNLYFIRSTADDASAAPTYDVILSAVGDMSIGLGAAGTRKLEVHDNAVSDYVAYFFNDGNNANRVGIAVQCGEDSPAGTNVFFEALEGDGAVTGRLQTTGAGTFALADISDEQVKLNILPTQVDALSIINALSLIKYNRVKGEFIYGQTSIGFSAQNCRDVFPQMVSEDQDTGLLMTMRTELIPVLVKAVQEQQTLISQLEARIAALEN